MSPDITENTVSILSITVRTSTRVMPKVAELFINNLSEQDVAKSHDNNVLIFDSPSTILKMERPEDESKSTAYEQRFLRRAVQRANVRTTTTAESRNMGAIRNSNWTE